MSAAITSCAIAGAALVLAVVACTGPQSALDARGPAAARIAGLWWSLLGVATAIYVVVLAGLIGAVVRPHRHDREPATADGAADRRWHRWILGAGVGFPAVVLAAAFAITLRTHAALEPHAAADLTVRVVGRQWWWEITYPGTMPGDEVVTANELHIPTGRRVRLELTSADVIHSFWVPNLQGKTDLVPGRTTLTWLQADQPGISRGQCAEYCGLQHAGMALLVVAEPPTQFAQWLAEQRQPGAAPADDATRHGQQVFLGSGCGYCHAVRGINTVGLLAPDLTHLATRRTIAAGTLENTRERLTAWIADPQRLKPGNRMLRIPLDSSDLRAVVAYLESLR